MKKLSFCCLIGIGLITASCSSNEEITPNGEGAIKLSVKTETSFNTPATRAVDEESYKDVNKYQVQILNSVTGKVEKDYATYSEVPESIELNNGSYELKAFYGIDSEASRDAFYVEGSTSFAIDGDTKSISVACAPVCGKVRVNFDAKMADYFSDYSVVYETQALTTAGGNVTWTKTDTEPWYLRVNKGGEDIKATIRVTRKSDNKQSTVEKVYRLEPNKAWTLGIAPQDNGGSLSLTITIDESTEDETIDIVIPSEWI